jgi:hypothetical protein
MSVVPARSILARIVAQRVRLQPDDDTFEAPAKWQLFSVPKPI